jgi:hypothetical protein
VTGDYDFRLVSCGKWESELENTSLSKTTPSLQQVSAWQSSLGERNLRRRVPD